MNRRSFLGCAGRVTTCCGAAFALSRAATAVAAAPENSPAASGAAAKPAGPPLTPDRQKVEWAKTWVSRLMKNLDAQLDPEARRKLMMACGHTCFLGAHGEGPAGPPSKEREQGFLDWIRKQCGPDSVRVKDGKTTVDYRYIQNPAGLKPADGYCLCPLVEDGPPNLSPTFCLCSLGYVREMFRQQVGRPVEVELVRSVHRGDRECRFEVRF